MRVAVPEGSPTPPDHPYAPFLAQMQKPGRYLGGEEQQVVKDPRGLVCRFVLAFPDLYEVGMSHLGTRILYDLVNRQPDLVCERAFSPWRDLEEELRTRKVPLVSLETYQPLASFDVVGFSLQYELCYTNVLLNLDLGGIPLRSEDRTARDPIVLAGGPTATHPEPLAPFIDAFLVGEAEEVLPDLLRRIGHMRRAGASRAAILALIGQTPGMYVPSFYRVERDERTGLEVVVGRSPAGEAAHAPEKVGRVYVRDLGEFPFPERFPIPYAEAVFDRASVEITRGCTEGCRFCQAGIIYRPVRERTPEAIKQAILAGVDNAGFAETSLTALSTADVSCINPLIKELVPELAKRKVALGVASLRAYGLDGSLLDEIKRVGISGLTFAPEAGTQRMRDVINKNVSEEDILASARRIFERGYDRMKMYFIIGLPTETDEDVVGIIETGARVRALAKSLGLPRLPTVTASVSQHVPKPHTPFQWAAMDAMEDLESKVHMLRELAKRAKIGLKTHDVRESWLECLFARGDRRMARALEAAYRRGARFDGWREYFSFERWLDALEEAEIDPEVYTRTLPVGARLPWDHIDIGLEPDFLAGEYRKALKSRLSPPCGKPFGDKVHATNTAAAETDTRRLVCYDCGIACDMSQMRDERLVALRTLDKIHAERVATEAREEAEQVAPTDRDIVARQRLVGRLAPSKLADDSAFKDVAEAPHSRLRIVFGKHGPMRFLSHLDLLRILPRMFRRAHVSLAFTRGFNPVPRMAFGPALALGVAADEEVVDVDVILPESLTDMSGELGPDARARLERSLLARLREVAPPGLVLVHARLVEPGEVRLGRLVAAADYVVELEQEQAERLRRVLQDQLAADSLPVQREVKAKHRKNKKSAKPRRASPVSVKDLDVRPYLLDASVDGSALRFRLETPTDGGVRPREVVDVLLGERVGDHKFRRERLLARQGDAFVPFTELGAVRRA